MMASNEVQNVSKRKKCGSSAPFKKDKADKIVPNTTGIQVHTLNGSKRRLLAKILLLLIGCCFGYIHMHHVSSLFESDRHFSHLSQMEREMTFRTEMGLYYSYYKRLVEAPTYLEGLYQLRHDNLTEFPSVINTLERFNLLPEVIIAFQYRSFMYMMDMFGMDTKQCWQISRGPTLPLITSCEGLGEPVYFYLQMVWFCAGLTVTLLFAYGTFLSDSILGGVIVVLCFFYNHNEATRVQWTPPLRESFAYPFILMHTLFITFVIQKENKTQPLAVSNKRNAIEILMICLSTLTCLSLWQFSQFVIATQLTATFILFIFKLISKNKMSNILYGILLGTLHAGLIQSGIPAVMGSLLPCMLISMILAEKALESRLKNRSLKMRICCYFTWAVAGTLAIRTKLRVIFPNKDDNHIINILKSKLWNYKDFHTLLYTCSPEFDFISSETFSNLMDTLLLPLAVVVIMSVLRIWFKGIFKSKCEDAGSQSTRNKYEMMDKENILRFVEPHVLYVILQLGAFLLMAVMIMRLKLFFTPHLCILVSLLASRKYFSFIKNEKMHWVLVGVLVCCMSYHGIENVQEQHKIKGEFINLSFEEFLNWVKTETVATAVFAGPMPIMANLLLSTGRPIVNHPHYENYALRQRTKWVYSIFSRKSSQEVFSILSTLKVDYVVLEESWCFRESRKGCGIVDLWDVEEPENKKNPPLCPQLFIKSPLPFHRVFSNEAYVVLQLHSQYVEFRPRKTYKE